MNMYHESSLFSGRKGAALTAVILLHVLFGFAFYSELGARIRTTLDPSPFNLTPLAPPPPSSRVAVRMDPKHPLKIGKDFYPDASVRANEMGRCVVQVTVAADGRVIAAAIQTRSGFDRLDQACLNAVRGQRMLPATEGGKPIESTASIPILWNLSE